MVFGTDDVGVFEKIEAQIINLKPSSMYQAVRHFGISGGIGMSYILDRIDDLAFDKKDCKAD